MDNMHQPPDGDPQDYWPTQDLGPAPAQPGPGRSWDQPSGPPPGPGWGQPSGSPRRRRQVWWGAGLALVALLGGGLAAAKLSGSSSPAPGAPTGQAAALNSMLNSASSPASSAAAGSSGTISAATSAGSARKTCQSRVARLQSSGHPLAARVARRFCGHRLARIRALAGIHGQFTFETKTGPRTVAFERGVIESVSSRDVVVQAKDGATWTWVLESNTVLRQGGKKASTSALSDGERVFVGGPVVSGGYQARLIVIRPSSGSSSPSSTPSPSPSPSSGS